MFAEKELKGVRIFSFSELSQLPHFIFAVTSRQTDSDLGQTGETNPLAIRSSLSNLLDIYSEYIFTLRQVHSARTVVLGESCEKRGDRLLGPADGVIVTKPGLYAAIRTADCVPVVAVAAKRKQVALFHMGWRGGKERILERGLGEFLRLSEAEPEEILVGIGPCIRSCCYEVGDDVRKAFEQAAFDLDELFLDRHLDLVAVARIQLRACGVEDFLDSGLCTSCRTDLFYSYRREATNSRMWTLAGFNR